MCPRKAKKVLQISILLLPEKCASGTNGPVPRMHLQPGRFYVYPADIRLTRAFQLGGKAVAKARGQPSDLSCSGTGAAASPRTAVVPALLPFCWTCPPRRKESFGLVAAHGRTLQPRAVCSVKHSAVRGNCADADE